MALAAAVGGSILLSCDHPAQVAAAPCSCRRHPLLSMAAWLSLCYCQVVIASHHYTLVSGPCDRWQRCGDALKMFQFYAVLLGCFVADRD